MSKNIKHLTCDPRYPHLFYDHDEDVWIDSFSGRIFNYYPSPNVEICRLQPENETKATPFMELSDYLETLTLLVAEGNFCTLNKAWRIAPINPDLRVGQTVPWSEYGFEQCRNKSLPRIINTKDGIRYVDFNPPIEFKVHSKFYTHPVFCSNADTVKGSHYCVPNTVDIEHKIGIPRSEEQADYSAQPGSDAPDSKVEFNSTPIQEPCPEAFEALHILVHLLKTAPMDAVWKIVPTLLDFLFHSINISTNTGEIRISDLLSQFAKAKASCKILEKQVNHARDVNKHLRHLIKSSKTKRFRR